MRAESVRPAAVAGAFYSADPEALRREVKGYLDAVPAQAMSGEVLALLVPHAGYRYSAAVAAYGYKALDGMKADTVVIIGHDAHARGIVALLSDVPAFETPLGRVEVDTELVAALTRENRGIIVHNDVHRRDHTVEVQLPFLQVVMPGCRIVPALFGEPKPETCRVFAEAIARQRGSRRLLIVASTDLTHYPPSDVSARIDKETMSRVERMDVPALFTYLDEAARQGSGDNVQTAMCASGGVGTALTYARAMGPAAVHVLHRANSGDVRGGDPDRVVGYAAAVIVRTTPTPSATDTRDQGQASESLGKADATATTGAQAKAGGGFSLPPEVQKELLTLARRRITTAVRREPFDYRPAEALAGVLGQPAAVFVTLHKKGRLRGCIGMTEARMELWRAVQEMAMSAAFKDWRFSPVREEELPDLHIEISVLSPLEPVSSAGAIRPREHGVVVRRAGHSGLFLPQVWEQIPEKGQFLSVLCSEKAGLPEDAWKDPETRLLVFTVFAFAEP